MDTTTPLRIVKLEAANVKRLVAVEITPDGNLVVIGGRNGQGKTSVLDSIAYALGGKDLLCEVPLRKGTERGHVEVDLGDLVVRRTFTPAGGGTLTVSSKDGAVYRSPQTMLDKLVGRLSFDPLEFSRMEPRRQLETLRSLVGLDFSAIDAKRQELYEERTLVNRTTRQLEAKLAAMPEHSNAPAEPVSVAALLEELDAAEATHERAREATEAAEESLADLGRLQREHAAAVEHVTELERQLTDARAAVIVAAERVADQKKEAQSASLGAQHARGAIVDTALIRERIAEAEAVNDQVRANVERAEQVAEVEESKAEAARLTAEIEALDAQKAAGLASAEFPVPELSFDESGVTLGGVPFSQASAAEQVRVSVAMGLAMNPRLRVLLIRDGSLLDDESLGLVAKLAADAEAQVWLERVGDGEECQVVIEDGAVRPSAEQTAIDAEFEEGAES